MTEQRPGQRPEKKREPGPGRVYQGALEAVLAIVVMAVIGAWADSRFGTAPILLLAGLAIGFGSFILRLLRLLKEVGPPSGDDANPPE